jgi:hypothetical protein
LIGKYIFGDFSRTFTNPDGRLFYLDADGDLSQIFEFQLGPSNDPLDKFVLGFGEDESNDIFLLTSENLAPIGDKGKVFRITGGEMLLVELESFTADATRHGVLLNWRTISEIDNIGFRLLRERVVGREKSIEVITPELIPARGNNLVGADYEFVDTTQGLRGTVRYYLEDIDSWGRTTRHGPVEINLPGHSRVHENRGRSLR